MFKRKIQRQLAAWKADEHRKPLILRGARQVGKTTLVREFSKEFENYLHFNLEQAEAREMLETDLPLPDLVTFLFARQGLARKPGATLLFIDEIQNSPKTIARLRYFYEEMPQLHVITAGSLLENLVDVQTSFPVGRVAYLPVRPCSFREFVGAMGEENLLQVMDEYPLQAAALHDRLMVLFQQYVIVGGMPEAVNRYAEQRDVFSLDPIYETLLQAYRDDTEKYVRGKKINEVVRFILDYGWYGAGEAVTLSNFGGSSYKSREVGEAFRLLQKAMLLELVYPTTAVQQPPMPELKRAPKLIWLDTGLVNYAAGVRKELIGPHDIMDAWRGKIGEHIVAQELLTLNDKISQKRVFWTHGRGESGAEVDFVWTIDSQLYPIEVKTGTNSKLRSLHRFVEEAPIEIGIRVWSKPLTVNRVQTVWKKKSFTLINLPFYMLGNLEQIVRMVRDGQITPTTPAQS